jgi:hypothetical protein
MLPKAPIPASNGNIFKISNSLGATWALAVLPTPDKLEYLLDWQVATREKGLTFRVELLTTIPTPTIGMLGLPSDILATFTGS